MIQRRSVALLGVAVCAYAVSTLLRTHSGFDALWEGGVRLTVLAATAALMAAVAWRRRDRVWWAMAGAVAAWATGSVIWGVAASSGHDLGAPSPADGGWLAFYVLAGAAVVGLVRRRVPQFHRALWLDAFAASCGVTAVATTELYPALSVRHVGRVAEVVTNLAYPVADLALLVILLASFAVLAWRPGRDFALVGAGLLVFVVADSVYLGQIAAGHYHAGTWLDAMWPAALWLIVVAGCQRPPAATVIRPEAWSVLIVPFAFSVGAIGLLVAATRGGVPPLAVGFAAATLAVTLARAAVTFGTLRRLADIRRLARTDELTNLPNRRHLEELLAARFAAGEPVSLLLLDLDRFKDVNETLGHGAGDQLLRSVASRLTVLAPEAQPLGRLGGDEFAIVLPSGEAGRGAEIADRIVAGLAEAFVQLDVPIQVDASIGVATSATAATAEDLLRQADIAMYDAKRSGAGIRVFSEAMAWEGSERLQLVADLRRALERDEFVLYYQPIAEIGNGGVTGVEALVRWQHPERGLLPPVEFVPLLEQLRMVPRLTALVLERALQQCRDWRARGFDVRVSVNLSADDLIDPTLPARLGRLLQHAGVPGSALAIEITEETLVVDPDTCASVLAGVRGLGVHVAIDDFGTGYSSLAYLWRLPIDELKIDRAFVSAITTDLPAGEIVMATIQLAHALGLTVVGEGVEDARILRLLQDMGCERAQGYHLSRPLPAPEVEPMLVQESGAVSA